jgi:serine/threonine protein kinase
MPPPSTVAEFLDLLRRSQLVPEARLEEVLQRHREHGTLPQKLDPFANLLIREGLLTYFQAKQLKMGRYKRFTIAGKYKLLELIGVGGMGAVYLCEHILMRRLVALKVLPLEKLSDPSHEERFYREARAVAALDHPNIVRAYDIDRYEQLHFLVMEYVDGTSLQEIVARYVLERRLFDPIRAAHYIAQAALGLQHGHELGMVHRDIKPGNLLLDRQGCIKVLDMGLARFFNKQQDCVTEKYEEKCVLGTADYLAPEQAVSNIVDIRADIYSLGATFYFLLTGQPPFPEGTVTAKLVAHQTRQPRPVESFRKDVPPRMLQVLQIMMAKNPADRFQQPLEVAEALSEWAHQPIDPPPAREMPQHCPLVRMIAGPTTSQSNTVPLARLLFGSSPRGVGRATSTSPSSSMSSSVSQSTVTFGPLPGSSPPISREITVTIGPTSTARSSAAPTLPSIQSPLGSSEGSTFLPTLTGPSRTLGWPFWLLLAALLLLFALALFAAYQLGRNAVTRSVSPCPHFSERRHNFNPPQRANNVTILPSCRDESHHNHENVAYTI